MQGSRLTLFLCADWKLLDFSVSIEIDFDFCDGRNWLDLSVGGRTWLDLSVGGRTWLDSSVGLKLIWFLCGWSKLTCFFYEGRSSLVFSVSMPIYLNFMGGPNWLDFSLGDRTWLDSSVGWNEYGCCCVGCRKWRFSVWWIGIDLVFVLRSKMTWFKRRHRNQLGFCVGASISTWY